MFTETAIHSESTNRLIRMPAVIAVSVAEAELGDRQVERRIPMGSPDHDGGDDERQPHQRHHGDEEQALKGTVGCDLRTLGVVDRLGRGPHVRHLGPRPSR